MHVSPYIYLISVNARIHTRRNKQIFYLDFILALGGPSSVNEILRNNIMIIKCIYKALFTDKRVAKHCTQQQQQQQLNKPILKNKTIQNTIETKLAQAKKYTFCEVIYLCIRIYLLGVNFSK